MLDSVNPVLRVRWILEEGKKLPSHLRIGDAWSKILGVDLEKPGDVLLALAGFIELVKEARMEMSQLKSTNPEIYQKPFDKLLSLLSHINLEARWDGFTKELDPATITAIEFCDAELQTLYHELVIDSNDLNALLGTIQDLILEVVNSEYPHDLKAVILDSLSSIEKAILAYRLNGIKGLRKAMELTIGGLFLVTRDIENLPEKEKKDSGLFARFISSIDSVNKLISFAQGVNNIAPSIIALISGGMGI